MAHQVIFPKNEGTKQGSLPAIVQGSTLETITILALYKDGSNVDMSSMTVTATMTDRDNSTTDVTGTLTGANGSFTWAYSAGDIGTAGRFSTIITYTDGVDSWSSEPVDFDIIANPAATAVQNDALVGIPASDAAWVSVSADGGALGTAAYIDVSRIETLEDALIPVAIADMTATASGYDAIDLTWTYTAIAPTTAFRLYRKTGIGGTYALIASPAIEDTSYADSGLVANTEYYYRLDAYNDYFQTAGNEAVETTGDLAFSDAIEALPGLIAYWPLNETTGTVADNALGNADLDGAYNAPRVQLATEAFLNGEAVANFYYKPAAIDYGGNVEFNGANMSAEYNWGKGWHLWFIKPTLASFNDTVNSHTMFLLRRNSAENMYGSFVGNGSRLLSFALKTGNATRTMGNTILRNQWMAILLRWDTAAGTADISIDGAIINDGITTLLPPILDAESSPASGLFSITQSYGLPGGAAYCAWGADTLPTDAQFEALYNSLVPNSRNITIAGDSKSDSGNDLWQMLFLEAADTATGDLWRESPRRLAVGGYKASDLLALIEAKLPQAPISKSPEAVLLAIGANDQSAGTNEATYKTNLTAIIDAYISKCPGSTIYVTIPYRADVATPTSPATMKTWIQAVVATYAEDVELGDDETVWFAGDIATYSDDDCHYNAAGAAEKVNQVRTLLGI